MSKSLPSRPNLRWLRDQAKARRRSGEFPSLALAHLAIAREYGFASWPRLKSHVDALTLGVGERAAILIASACSDNPRRAATILEVDPAIVRHDLASACVAGEADEVARRVRANPDAAHEPTGPNGWQPLLYACFSRLSRIDPERAAGIRSVVAALLDAGADPNASFMHGDWLQAPIYGAAGIAGDAELTKLLLAAGGDPNDAGPVHVVGEALYHACEHRDPTCAQLLIEAGTAPDVVDYCLGRALNFDNHAMVAMFCSHGVRPSAEHLHQALWRRRPVETIAVLLDASAPLEEPDQHGLTPLQIALCWGDGPTATTLRDRGASDVKSPGETATAELRDEMVILAVQRGDRAAVLDLLSEALASTAIPQARMTRWVRPAGVARSASLRTSSLAAPGPSSAAGGVRSVPPCMAPATARTQRADRPWRPSPRSIPRPMPRSCACCWQSAPECRSGSVASMACGRRCCWANSESAPRNSPLSSDTAKTRAVPCLRFRSCGDAISRPLGRLVIGLGCPGRGR